MFLSDLKPKYDYGLEGKCIIIKLWKRKNEYVEITIDWFDYNPGNKFEWLIVRECKLDSKGKKKYTNYKLENIHEQVKVIKRKGEVICV